MARIDLINCLFIYLCTYVVVKNSDSTFVITPVLTPIRGRQ